MTQDPGRGKTQRHLCNCLGWRAASKRRSQFWTKNRVKPRIVLLSKGDSFIREAFVCQGRSHRVNALPLCRILLTPASKQDGPSRRVRQYCPRLTSFECPSTDSGRMLHNCWCCRLWVLGSRSLIRHQWFGSTVTKATSTSYCWSSISKRYILHHFTSF